MKNNKNKSSTTMKSDSAKRINAGTPWTMQTGRDGTEDFVSICNANGDELATSGFFWFPEADMPIPQALAAIHLMGLAPKLLEAVEAVVEICRTAQASKQPKSARNVDLLKRLNALRLNDLIVNAIYDERTAE